MATVAVHAADLDLLPTGPGAGDGPLNYGLETIGEFYDSILLPHQHASISPDYQFVLNPAYNRDRGPVHVVALRPHIAF